MIKTSKEICVIDTCSLKNTTTIELAGNKLIEYVRQVYEITIPEKVNSEFIQVSRERTPHFISIEKEDVYKNCLKIVQKWFHKSNMKKEYETMDSGEKHCVALALYLSRQRRKLSILLTDDFKAKPLINKFIQEQQVGLTISTPDLIVQIFTLFSRIRRNHVLAAINDFKRENPPKHLDPESFRNKLYKSCRVLGSCLCLLKCLQPGMGGFKV